MPLSFFNKIFFILVLFGCSACIEDTVQSNQKTAFFDLKTYFAEQVDQLSNVKKIKKSVSINGVVEELTQDSINFEEELAIFAASDINRVAWYELYQIDSTFTINNQLESITYTALDEKLKTKSIAIYYKDKAIDNIVIKNNQTNFVSSSIQDLDYSPSRGYDITSQQKTTMSDERLLKVSIRFLR